MFCAADQVEHLSRAGDAEGLGDQLVEEMACLGCRLPRPIPGTHRSVSLRPDARGHVSRRSSSRRKRSEHVPHGSLQALLLDAPWIDLQAPRAVPDHLARPRVEGVDDERALHEVILFILQEPVGARGLRQANLSFAPAGRHVNHQIGRRAFRRRVTLAPQDIRGQLLDPTLDVPDCGDVAKLAGARGSVWNANVP